MTSVIAPPPAAINDLLGLLSLIKNADAAQKLVDDLKQITDDFNAASVTASKLKADNQAAVDALVDEQAKADAKMAKLAQQTQEQKDAKAEADYAKATMVSEKLAFDAQRQEAEKALALACTILDERQAAIAAAEAKAEANLAELESLKAVYESKLAILRA